MPLQKSQRNMIDLHRPGPSAPIFQRGLQFTPPATESQQPCFSWDFAYKLATDLGFQKTGPLIATQSQQFPHYLHLLDSSFLQPHRLFSVLGCRFLASRSSACDKSLFFCSTFLPALPAVPAEALHTMASASVSRK